MTKQNKIFMLLFLGILSALGRMITDLYIPAVPEIATYYEVNVATVQLTLTSTMLGLGFGQLFIGPFSDKFGRKNPLFVSILCYLIVTVAIVFSNNISFVIFLRFLQGFFASGSVVISRAIASDLYSGKRLSKFFGMIMIINGIGPVLAPVIGAFVLDLFNWKVIFLLLAILGLFLFVCTIIFKESLDINLRSKERLSNVYLGIFSILRDTIFLRYVLLQSLTMAATFAYVSASPFLFQNNFGLSTFVYSLIFAFNGVAMIIGTIISIRLGVKKSLLFSFSTMFASGILLLFTFLYKENVYVVEFLFFMISLGAGAVFPSASSLVMNRGKENAGASSAVLGFVSFLFGGLVSPIVGIGDIAIMTSLIICIATFMQLVIFNSIKKNI